MTLTTGGVQKDLVKNFYDGKTFPGLPSYPPNAPGLCGSRWGAYWQIQGTTPENTFLFNPAAAVPFNLRGSVSASVTPATTTCFTQTAYGAAIQTQSSNGAVQNTTIEASTNYAAPSVISTQTYSESISYNSWLGVTGKTGSNGEQLGMTYDWWGRPMTATSPFGATSSFSYPSANVQTRTGPDGFTRTTLDGLGRTVKVERGPNISSLITEVATEYAPCACSPLGKLKRVSQPYPAGGTATAWTTYTYDGMGRTVAVTLPDGLSATTTSYSGNQTTVTDPAGKWKTFTTDVEGNLVTVTEPNPAGGALTTSYTYDWMKHLAGVSMMRGGVTQTRAFVYDDQGRMTSGTNPESGTVAYYYNADNTLWYKHDAKGNDTVYTYDSAKRVTMVQQFPNGKSNAEDACQKVTYTYGANLAGSTYSQNFAGRLTAVQYTACATGHNKAISEQYSYHPAGAVTGKRLETVVCGVDQNGYGGCAPATSDVAYSYDSKGSVASVLYPGEANPYVYGSDWAGRHVSLSQTQFQPYCGVNVSTALVQGAAFDIAGRLTGIQTRTGLVTQFGQYTNTCANGYEQETRGYNTMGQMTSQAWAPVAMTGGMTNPRRSQNR